MAHKKGDQVTWHWGEGKAEGVIIEKFTSKVTRKIKGTEITRNATSENPAYLIKQEDGDHVLKLESELS